MDIVWTLIGVFLVPSCVALYALMRIADREDRTARHTEKRANPFSDVDITVTRWR